MGAPGQEDDFDEEEEEDPEEEEFEDDPEEEPEELEDDPEELVADEEEEEPEELEDDPEEVVEADEEVEDEPEELEEEEVDEDPEELEDQKVEVDEEEEDQIEEDEPEELEDEEDEVEEGHEFEEDKEVVEEEEPKELEEEDDEVEERDELYEFKEEVEDEEPEDFEDDELEETDNSEEFEEEKLVVVEEEEPNVFEEEEEEVEEGDEFEEEEEEEEDGEADESEEDDEVAARNNEEAGENEKDDKPSIPPTASAEDATDRLYVEKQIGIKTGINVPDDKTEDTEGIKHIAFTETEPLENQIVGCAYKGEGINVMESDFGNNESSQDVDVKDAKDTDYSAICVGSKGFEAAEHLSTNDSICAEPVAVEYNKVDCGFEGNGVKEMQFDKSCQHFGSKDAEDTDVCPHPSEPKNEEVNHASEGKDAKREEPDCKEKERHINKKVAESTDVYAPISESKGTTEITKPICSKGLDSEMVFMQEGGVEDMELDSEENIVHESDVDGTVVNSIQENIALNSHNQLSFDIGADALNNKTVIAGSLKSSSSGGKETMHNHVLKLGESKYVNLDLKEHIMPKQSSSLAATPVKRSLPTVPQLMDMNKRPTILCDYYAKGWCIKGNSCRFVHAKEHKDNSSKPQERDLASANGENQVIEGVGDSSTKTIFPGQQAETHIHQINNKLGYSSFESRLIHSAKHEFNCGVVASSSAFASRLSPSSGNATPMFNDPLQSIANRYINLHLHPSAAAAAAADVYSSRYVSAINGSSDSIISSKSNPFDAYKILSGSLDINASSSSLGRRAQQDRLNSLGLVPKSELYKWEPSKPFRPSYRFSIPNVSSPGSLYDPLRDGIEHNSLDFESFKAERIHYPTHQSSPDSASAENQIDMDGYNQNMPDRYGHSRSTGVKIIEAEVAESCVADHGYLRSTPGGDKGSGTSNGKDLSETNKNNTVSAEKSSKQAKKKIHSNDVRRGFPEDDQSESKTLRQFRVALIEFVKELLKPAWRVGKLSKEAHNLIVKKTVKKVLDSLHNHQVPSTAESVQQYLSASQPKMMMLLEDMDDGNGIIPHESCIRNLGIRSSD